MRWALDIYAPRGWLKFWLLGVGAGLGAWQAAGGGISEQTLTAGAIALVGALLAFLDRTNGGKDK